MIHKSAVHYILLGFYNDRCVPQVGCEIRDFHAKSADVYKLLMDDLDKVPDVFPINTTPSRPRSG